MSREMVRIDDVTAEEWARVREIKWDTPISEDEEKVNSVDDAKALVAKLTVEGASTEAIYLCNEDGGSFLRISL